MFNFCTKSHINLDQTIVILYTVQDKKPKLPVLAGREDDEPGFDYKNACRDSGFYLKKPRIRQACFGGGRVFCPL